MKENKIDVVITWVDGSDEKWLKERAKYVSMDSTKKQDVAGDKRYQDNGLLRYLFRSLETFAPWVNKIHFVTYGHLPIWLNTKNPRLNIVKHEDFLPEKYRPTFSSVPLNLNFHRIPDLAEQFIYFNDDMFLLSPCKESDFFVNGKVRDMAVMDTIPAIAMETYWYMVYNDVIMLNKNIKKRTSIKKNFFKWINPIYGKNMFKNIILYPFPMFTGIYETHLPACYLKSVYEQMWDTNFDVLDEVSMHKTRTNADVSENFFRYVQLAQGKFEPINKLKIGRYCSMSSNRIEEIITSGKYKYICINDENFGEPYERTIAAFETILPNKSAFEKF